MPGSKGVKTEQRSGERSDASCGTWGRHESSDGSSPPSCPQHGADGGDEPSELSCRPFDVARGDLVLEITESH